MKRITTILTFLMLLCMGAGAASPATGAYPVEGKTYYLYANKYNSTDRYYLYWDNTNSALKRADANSKENTNYYKWTVSVVNDHVYTITNVGTGTKLTWDNSKGLTLGSGTDFDLSQQVADPACVSLYAATPHFCCVKNDVATFSNSYKFSSYAGTNTSYSSNFVFEEVLPAHSLTDGSYYTIYCDNDDKQYLWDNGTSLAASNVTPSTAALSCIWKCIVSGDYYNFKNLATGRYLGWKAMSPTAYNFTITTTNALHDGCALIYGVAAKRYLNLNVNNTFDQGTGTYNKVTDNYSSDFRFDEITPSASITTLPTDNDKIYIINNVRGTWNFADDATSMTAVTVNNTNLGSEAQQVALIYKNENYYLYSINAGKYLTANNTLTSMPTDDEQLSITATGNDTYPWFFKFKNVSDKNINVNKSQIIYINEYTTIDDGNRNAIFLVGDHDLDAALDLFDKHTVTYNLSYGGNNTFRTVEGITVTTGGDPADFVPAAFVATGVDLSYSPATITAETETVTVTATWNGPFQISPAPSDGNFASGTKWYTIAHNYSERANNYIWKYNGTDNVVPETVATDNFAGVTNNHLFCFVGDPYTGFTIYNKAAGTSKNVYSSAQNNQVTMNATAQLFIPSRTDNYAVSDGYFSLKPSGSSYYLNWNKTKLAGWTSADNGGTCWVVAPGQYYLNFIDGLYLDAPVGAVGTRSYFQTVADPTTEKSTISSMRTTVAGNMYSDQLNTLNVQLTPIAGSSVITLTDGYYRIVNACNGFPVKPTVYFDSTLGKMKWSVASNTSDNVNSIVRITTETPSIYVPNAQKYMKLARTDNSDQIGDVAGTTTFTSLGDAQYKITIGGQVLHAYGHNEGAGTADALVGWDGGLNSASAWYIVKVSELPVGLHTIGEVAYATTCLPFDVTISNANAYTMVENGDWLVPTQLEGNQVPAGTAVLLKGTSATATATINTGAAFGTDNENALQGTYVPMDFALTEKGATATAEYFLGVYSGAVGFYRSEVPSKSGFYTLGANKAYLSSDAEARGFAIMWDESETTGVNEVIGKMSEVTDGAIYDLQGRKVANPSRGMYIINGRKVVIK